MTAFECPTIVSPTIVSPWLGEIRLDPECEIYFPAGLPGFEEERRMAPVEIPAQRPLLYLQSVERARVCFVALPVYVIHPGFRLDISDIPDDERILLGLTGGREAVIGEDVLCVVLLMPSRDSVQVNLNAPIVVNLHNQRAAQIVRPGATPDVWRLSAENGWAPLC